MTHFRLSIPLVLAASAAWAAEPVSPGGGAIPDASPSLRLLTPRDAFPVEMPPLTDAYRCEPLLRIEEGIPAAFLPDGEVSGRENRNTARFCEG